MRCSSVSTPLPGGSAGDALPPAAAAPMAETGREGTESGDDASCESSGTERHCACRLMRSVEDSKGSAASKGKSAQRLLSHCALTRLAQRQQPAGCRSMLNKTLSFDHGDSTNDAKTSCKTHFFCCAAEKVRPQVATFISSSFASRVHLSASLHGSEWITCYTSSCFCLAAQALEVATDLVDSAQRSHLC